MDKTLLEILVCPVCKGKLGWHRDQQELWCRADKLAYRIEDNIPIMLESEARKLTSKELDHG